MGGKKFHCFLFLLPLVFRVVESDFDPFPLPLDSQIAMEESQLSVMLELKSYVDNDSIVLYNWNATTPCGQWLGVTCNYLGHVTAIILSDFPSLHSDRTVMPATIQDTPVLSGNLPNSIGLLHGLTVLNLNGNDITGTIPDSIGNLTKLTTLDLSENALSGNIPDSLWNCSQLVVLCLNSNFLTGDSLSNITKLPNLYYLDLSQNRLTGELPTNINVLGKLSVLSLGGNVFSGELPANLSGMGSLVEIKIGVNGFSGTIPNLLNMTNLRVMHFYFCLFSGPLPVIEAPNLEDVQFGHNFMTGNFVPWNTPVLKHLSVRLNRLSGSIPNVTGTRFPLLESLDLSANNFSGPIPEGFYKLKNLHTLHLAENQLQGPLNPDLGQSTSLTVINVASNRLNGTIPIEFINLLSLTVLNLDDNQFTGSTRVITDLANEGTLVWIFLRNNNFTGIFLANQIPANDSLYVTLNGNPLCSEETLTETLTLNQSCTQHSLLNYKPTNLCNGSRSFCTSSPSSSSPSSFSTAIYAYNGSCICDVPIQISLYLSTPPFTTYADQTNAALVDYLATYLDLNATQFNITFVTPLVQRDFIVNISVFSGPQNPFSDDRAKRILAAFNVPRRVPSIFIGPVSTYSALLPDLENLPGINPPPAASNPPPPPPVEDQNVLQWWGWVLLAFAFLLAVAIASGILTYFFIIKPNVETRSAFAQRVEQQFAQSIPLADIKKATNNFSDELKLGEGGYGTVYHGIAGKEKTDVIGEAGKMEWAVKRAKQVSMTGLQDFQNEVDVISKMSHKNLVRLIGYCDEDGEQILIYEFVSNGTLKDHLRPKKGKEKPSLTFHQRMEIAIGAAEGLRYLHNFAKPTVIHRDIKSENILLDANFQAKVADFGLLKDNLLSQSLGSSTASIHDDLGTGENTKLAGTPGYIDPEYYNTYRVTPKSDVYSFGVVLLELITGLPALVKDPEVEEDEQGLITLAFWVTSMLKSAPLQDVVDQRLQGEYNEEAVRKMLQVALKCLHKVSQYRPEMSDVASQLRLISSGDADADAHEDGEFQAGSYAGLQSSSSVMEEENITLLNPATNSSSIMSSEQQLLQVQDGR